MGGEGSQSRQIKVGSFSGGASRQRCAPARRPAPSNPRRARPIRRERVLIPPRPWQPRNAGSCLALARDQTLDEAGVVIHGASGASERYRSNPETPRRARRTEDLPSPVQARANTPRGAGAFINPI